MEKQRENSFNDDYEMDLEGSFGSYDPGSGDANS